MSRYHRIKTHPDPYLMVVLGKKTYEFRRNDRDYQVGDVLKLVLYNPRTEKEMGPFIIVRVVHVTRGPDYGVPEGFAVLGIRRTFLSRMLFWRSLG